MTTRLFHTLAILAVFITANVLFFSLQRQTSAFFLVLMVILLEISILVTRSLGAIQPPKRQGP